MFNSNLTTSMSIITIKEGINKLNIIHKNIIKQINIINDQVKCITSRKEYNFELFDKKILKDPMKFSIEVYDLHNIYEINQCIENLSNEILNEHTRYLNLNNICNYYNDIIILQNNEFLIKYKHILE